ncbi:hypothetical protein ACI7BZ_16060 [Xanthobacter sp. AM11]|uniref:hypothetical protein n=1 Tax=Xanthobacter sp. AM11 TaxID=3380643 RepID=UPI0039BF2BC5
MPSNAEIADKWIIFTFARLYESFPVRVDISVEEIQNEIGGPPFGSVNVFAADLASWLIEEKYIRSGTPYSDEVFLAEAVLTERALAALKKVPSAMSEKRSLGERLKDLSLDIGKSVAKKEAGEWIVELFSNLP